MKKTICIIMSIVMLCTMTMPASAVSTSSNALLQSESSFIDSEGKVNTVLIEIPAIGSSHVEYYIDEELTQTVDTILFSSKLSRGAYDTVSVTQVDELSGETTTLVEPISKYMQSSTLPAETAQPRGVYVYQGKIEYNTIYDAAVNYDNILFMWYQQGSTTHEYRTINTEAGMLMGTLVSVIAAILTIICPGLAIFAEDVAYAAVYTVGVSIVAGKVQSAFSKTYYVEVTHYNVKAEDAETSAKQIFTGEKCRVCLDGGGYSSTYAYNGYMPWNSNTVAYNLFNNFWATTYPGVKRYS